MIDRDFMSQIIIQIGTTERRAQSFDLDRTFGAGWQIFWFGSELQSVVCESMIQIGILVQFVNYLI